MRVLLINPDQRHAVRSEAGGLPEQGSGLYPPLGLLYLQAALERSGDHTAEVLDANVPGALASRLAARGIQHPDLVGFSALTPNLPSVVRAVDAVRKTWPTVATVMGGPHTELFSQQTAGLDGVDYVLPGEGELSLTALADALADDKPPPGGVLGADGVSPAEANAPPARCPNLAQLAPPDRARIDPGAYRNLAGSQGIFATMLTSRGCPYRCTFCSTPGGKPRLRAVEAIVEEVDACARLGVRHIYFLDDTFPTGGDRLRRLCEALIARPNLPGWSCRTALPGLSQDALALLKRAGCQRVQLGVETHNDEGLALLGKRTSTDQIERTFAAARRVGLPTMAYFILGLPNQKTADQLRQTVRFAKKIRPDFAMFNVLTLYPGTELFARAAARGLVDPLVWERFSQKPDPAFLPPVWDEFLDRRQLFELQDQAYRAFYLRPSVVLRQLRQGGLWSKVRVGAELLRPRRSVR